MGVRKGDHLLRKELDGVLERRRADIEALLDHYGVPRVEEPGAASGGARPEHQR